jgi:hypothetical protein
MRMKRRSRRRRRKKRMRRRKRRSSRRGAGRGTTCFLNVRQALIERHSFTPQKTRLCFTVLPLWTVCLASCVLFANPWHTDSILHAGTLGAVS